MKKLSLSKLVKRTILCLLVAVLLITGLVFAFDRYKATSNSFYNKYTDEYWNREVLDDFEYYEDIVTRTDKFNINKTDYVYPWVLDEISQSSLSDIEIIEYARYIEELNTFDLRFNYSTTYNSLKSELEALGAIDISTADWIEKYIGYTADDYADIEISETSAYNYVVNNNYSGTQAEFFSTLKSATSARLLLRALENAGFDGDEVELAKALSVDTDFDTYMHSIGDVDKYNEVSAQIEVYEVLVNRIAELNKSLKAWDDYYKEDLLGYGGLATDYPNKPVIEVEAEDGGTYQFWFNSYLTTFKLCLVNADGETVQEWLSNPEEEDSVANPSIKIVEKSIFQLSYSVLKGRTDTYSSYQYSVSDTQDGDSVTPQFAVKYDSENNKVVVWYKVSKRGIDYTYFPNYFTTERLNELLERNQILHDSGATDSNGKLIPDFDDPNGTARSDYARFTVSYYSKVTTDSTENEYGFEYYSYGSSNGNVTTSSNMSSMSKLVINDLYKYFYEWCGYTEEDLEADNTTFGISNEKEDPVYSLAIEYEITGNGLQVTVPGNSIKEDSDYPLTYIDLLPYFTSTISGVEGYTVVPDGSGAVINHDNGNTNYAKFQKRVYTTDLTNTSYVNQGSTNDVMFPMYAVINTGNTSGIIAYATEGAAQLMLTADVSGREDNYNKNYFTIYLRESQDVVIGSSYYKTELTKWTNAKVTNDIVIQFDILDSSDLSYSAAAKYYRNVLIEQYGLTENDTTTSPTLDLDIIGTYSYTNNFLGINYTAKDSLTTIDQLNEIIETFKEKGVTNINVFYLGWRKQTLVDYSFKSIKVSSLLGSKQKFKELLNNDDSTVNIYPYVSFGEINKYQESFGSYHYTSRGVDGNYIVKYPYDLNSNVYNKKLSKINILSPRYYLQFAKELANNYESLTSASTLAIDMLGSSLSGDYKKGIETFKLNAVKNQISSLEYITSAGISNLTLYTPYDYAFKYVTVAKNVPYETTQYEIFDYSIPFYQLVVNGLFDYSGDSVNENSEKGLTEQIMHMIETGSNISFTFTGDSSEKLLQTNYNYYYYTEYSKWVSDVKEVYSQLSELGIYNARLMKHEYIASNVYKVTYQTLDTNENIVVYLNYSRNSYIVDGITVPAKSYYKVS